MTRTLLDMDPGVDDALALLLALGSPELDVVAVTTVSGNVPVEQGTDNALRVLRLAGRDDVPVYRGATRPLVRDPVYAEQIHGPSGLGEAQLPPAAAKPAGKAIDRLLEALSGGGLTVVATGPLTNLAAAERRRPGVLRRADRIVVMGGAVRVAGNVTAASEFNFHADPHAARQVLASGAPILLVPLDATHQVLLSPERLKQMTGRSDSDVSRFVRAAAATPMAAARRLFGYDGLYLHDPLAMALAARPGLARTERSWLQVETEGEVTAGRVLETAPDHGTRVEWVTEVDRAGFMALFEDRVLARGTQEEKAA